MQCHAMLCCSKQDMDMVIKMEGVGGMGAGTMKNKCRDTMGVGMILRYVYVRTCNINNAPASELKV